MKKTTGTTGHPPLTDDACRAFRKKVYDYYRAHKRRFSWRETQEPYHILVSEIMLQQTQTDRVEAKFREFLAAFPDAAALAAAPLQEVLRVWQGMGYNRRALYLQKAAAEMAARYGGGLPRDVEALRRLPGIGPATARSIAAFAFNMPVVFIETNIRAVFIHEFFGDREGVTDAELLPLVEQTLDRKNARKWYNALMDYGVLLKARHKNPARKSAHYKKQSPFESSDRRVRGEIVRRLTRQGPMSRRELEEGTGFPVDRLERCLRGLVRDGLLTECGDRYAIP